MKKQLKKYIARYADFTDEEVNIFYSNLEFDSYKKKEFLLKEGQVCKYQYFIVKGLIRSYYIDAKGNENITQFGVENWWAINMESFTNGTISNEYLQEIEATEVLKISKEKLGPCYSLIPKLERLFRIIAEKMLIAAQKRNNYYLKMSSKERYNHLIDSFPKFNQRVPQYMIASYLEVTPEYLSGSEKAWTSPFLKVP